VGVVSQCLLRLACPGPRVFSRYSIGEAVERPFKIGSPLGPPAIEARACIIISLSGLLTKLDLDKHVIPISGALEIPWIEEDDDHEPE
jgi:hypothetical protein